MKATKLIHRQTVIDIYKLFKDNPNKVFRAKDIFKNNLVLLSNRYLTMFEEMGIIIRQDVRVEKTRTDKRIKAWKLKKH